MMLSRSTGLLRTVRAIPRTRAYSTPEGGPKKTINEESFKNSDKANRSVPLVTGILVASVMGGVFFFSEDMKSYLSGGLAAGDKSVVAQQKEGKMVSPFQKKD
ncbi:hypothetical protein MPSI1_000947 [Malassezia psittaci]|uniref:Uncharacterized protein n=1 Tax=Malassezia psittaci TaxID=1821823 RepID=A0AAF0F7L3_9BASI|nr:hypothetical protein MPSI1_000947 [Malassezia psittaci]